MANYTTTKFKVRNKRGSSTFFNNLNKTSGVMTITPNNGYVVSATDFSTSTLPSSISSVTFTNTTVAGQIDNRVLVTATFSETFVADKKSKISIKVNGDAKFLNEEDVDINSRIVLIDDKNKNKNATSLITANTNYNLNIDTIVGTDGVFDIVNNNITGNPKINSLEKIGELTITADDGYRFRRKPYLDFADTDSLVKLRLTSSTSDSNENITAYNFDIMQRTYGATNSNSILYIYYNAVVIPTVTKEIKRVYCDTTQITDLKQTKTINVYGDGGSEFKLTITKESDGSSILSSRYSNTTVLTPTGVLDAIGYVFPKKGIRSFYFNQEFAIPLALSTTLSGGMSDTTTMNITSKEGITVGDKISMGQILRGDVVKVASIHGSHNQVTTTKALTATSGDPVSFIRKEEKYHINIYPQGDTTLGSSISSIQPHYTITQSVRPVLTLKSTSSHATANPADITYAGKFNAERNELSTLKGAVGSTSTTTAKKELFKITYTYTASSGNWTDSGKTAPVWSNTNSSNSSWTNSVSADNGGTKIEIFNINVSGMGSNTATLTAHVLIKNFGSEDVTMVFDADNCFIDGA